MSSSDKDPAFDELHIRMEEDPKSGSFRTWTSHRRANSTPSEEVPGSAFLPLNPEAAGLSFPDLARSLRRRGLRGVESASEVQEVGAVLFDAIFQGPTRRIYALARGQAVGTPTPFRLRLEFPDEESIDAQRDNRGYLGSLPWESLYDPERKDFIALASRSSIVRSPPNNTGRNLLPLEGAPEALIILAEVDSQDWGATPEAETVGKIVQRHGGRVVIVRNPSEASLAATLRETTATIVHFIGHILDDRTGTSGLMVTSRDGDPISGVARTVVSASRLASIWKEDSPVQLVYFSMGYTLRFARSLGARAPAAVGFYGGVSDEQAHQFAAAFYETFLSGESLEASVGAGRRRVDRASPGKMDWALAILCTRDPGGSLVRPSVVHAAETVLSSLNLKVNADGGVEALPAVRVLRARETMARANLAALKMQADKAQETPPKTVPPFLQQQIDSEERKLREIHEALKSHGAAPVGEGL